MFTHKKYNLTFNISELSGFLKKPSVNVAVINGYSINYEIASFLESNGLEIIEHIKDEISTLDFGVNFEDEHIWGYNDTESVEIRNFVPDQAAAVFNTGGTEVIIPLIDFLEILEEWKCFVASVPKPHWLDAR